MKKFFENLEMVLVALAAFCGVVLMIAGVTTKNEYTFLIGFSSVVGIFCTELFKD